MYEKDYILRMIEMLGDLLRAIFGMITRGDLQQASRNLNEAFYTMLRKDAEFFHRIPPGEMTRTLIEDHNYTNNHLLILAELLYAEGELEFTLGNKSGSKMCYRKSLLLFEFVFQAERTYSKDRLDRMEEIRKKLEESGNEGKKTSSD
jgi:hypothetical protein